jgi:protein-S-isoprenylcysteine O-methyltransferase Ste14
MSLLSDLASPGLAAALSLAASLSLTAAILITTYVTSFCFTAPILNPDIFKETDRIGFANKLLFYYSCNTVVLLIGIYHAILCFTYPAPPSILCPSPSNLSPHLFTWNLHTILCVALILISGQILLLCFIQLGPNSNFQLTTPKKLITTGLYSWLQHPSYTANFIIFLTNGALLQRRDGVAACWLQRSIVDGEKFGMVLRTGYLLTVVIGCWALAQRVRNEEAMLKRTFGTKWEEYHKRTKRFIPGVI